MAVARPPDADRVRRFLCAYWLRPENALWMALRSAALSAVPFTRPSIDLSCGDGVFAFLHGGGAFDEAFDVFTAVDRLDRLRDDYVDMFDHVDDAYRPVIVAPPAHTIDVGTDLKPALLEKARRLALYDRLIRHDNNDPLPFPRGAFQTVYTNAAYWVRGVDAFLRDMARIVRPNGTVVLHVKLDDMRRYTLQRHRDVLGHRCLDIIGRGRFDTWPALASRRVWEHRFARAGLTIESVTPFVTRTHAHIWDIGLRPIAPLLVRMANALTPATRAAIKRDWVDVVGALLGPFCDPSIDLFDGTDEPAELQYVLRIG
ncbi:MAG: methyltransferase domain-containing protein [Phycisphaerae bacterium]